MWSNQTQGIYGIFNNINDRVYIGQSREIEKRWSYHKHCAFNENSYNHHYPLYEAIRKYGLDNFTFVVLEEVADARLLTEKEKHYFDTFRKNKLYNIAEPEDWQGAVLGRDVLQIEPDTLRVVAQYESIRDAGRAVGVNDNAIKNLLSGNGQTVAGYHWCFKEEWTAKWRPKELVYTHEPKAVVLLNENDEPLLIFDSIRDAAKAVIPNIPLETARRAIARVCSGVHPSAYGYKWRFANEVI